MPISVEQFLKQLEDCGILASEDITDFIPSISHPKDGADLARELVRQKKLTKFQAEEIYRGKGKSLLLGNYTLLDKIGAGGMGQVFMAEHRRMHRVVAVKILPADQMKDAAVVARFEREVTAAARLIHPNIVTAFDADHANGVHLLVMEYVEGSDLSALVKKNGPLPVEQAVDFILQAARGLEAAHAKGITHRDIKPSNLLVDKNGVVKILDMGLARLGNNAAGQAELTSTGAVMGTVDYMSPEQALNTKTVDARADIYSLGCSLFYLLAGKAIYGGDSLTEKLLAHQSQPIPSLRSIRRELPSQVESIFKKMVAKRVEDRYQTISEVIADLENIGKAPPSTAAAKPPRKDQVSAKASGEYEDDELLDALQETTFSVDGGTKRKTVQAQQRTGKTSKGKKGPPPWKNPMVLAGGGILGFLVLVAIIWSMSGQRGRQIANSNPPDKEGNAEAGDQANVNSGKNPDSQLADASNGAVSPIADSPGRKLQKEWADKLKLPVEYLDSMGSQFVLVPPGEFQMGSDERESHAIEKPIHTVRITKPFYIAKYPVMVSEFSQFVAVTGHVTAGETQKDNYAGWGLGDGSMARANDISWRNPGFKQTNRDPVVMVSPINANAYCDYVSRVTGKRTRLPTEAEWEYAARGPESLRYPWGNTWNGSLSNHADRTLRNVGYPGRHTDGCLDLRYPGYEQNNSDTETDGYAFSSPVGIFKNASWCGAFDMSGNVWQWLADRRDDNYYASSPKDDPKGGANGLISRRGGSFLSDSINCRSSQRYGGSGEERDVTTGFRLLMEVDQVALASNTGPPAQPVAVSPPTVLPVSPTAPKGKGNSNAVADSPGNKLQKEWADKLKLPAESTNSLGMEFVLVPPGEFRMGSDERESHVREKPIHTVRITKPFYIGKYPVMVSEFSQFVAATGYVTTGESKKDGYAGWGVGDGSMAKSNDISWRKPGFDQASRDPVVMVSPPDAKAYCEWMSKITGKRCRLPTEAEWEYAARGPDNLKYPWGNTWNGSLSNHADRTLRTAGYPLRHTDGMADLRYPGYEQNNSNTETDGYAFTSPVGVLKNASWCGAYDMSGNVWQWLKDILDDKYYASSPKDDPTGGINGFTVSRGGSSLNDSISCRSSQRFYGGSDERGVHTGFRIVMEVDQVAMASNEGPPAQPVAVSPSAVKPTTPTAPSKDDKLAFRDDGGGNFVFNTGVVQGSVQKDGTSDTLRPVSYIDPNFPINADNHGLLIPYRFLTPQKRYGFGSWEWPHTGQRLNDGGIQLNWEKSPDRPFAFSTKYRWKTADSVDLTLIFTPDTDLQNFELFVGSYFNKFSKGWVYVQDSGSGKPGFIDAAPDKGNMQLFPRNETVLSLVRDGRWTFPPYPNNWSIRNAIQAPLAIGRENNTSVTVLLMAPPEDCFAVSTMGSSDQGLMAIYLSLFGKDVKQGESITGRARLMFGKNITDEQAVQACQKYLSDTGSSR